MEHENQLFTVSMSGYEIKLLALERITFIFMFNLFKFILRYSQISITFKHPSPLPNPSMLFHSLSKSLSLFL